MNGEAVAAALADAGVLDIVDWEVFDCSFDEDEAAFGSFVYYSFVACAVVIEPLEVFGRLAAELVGVVRFEKASVEVAAVVVEPAETEAEQVVN